MTRPPLSIAWVLTACAPAYRIGEDYSAMELDHGPACGEHEGQPLACLRGDTCISEDPPLCRWQGGVCDRSGEHFAPIAGPTPCGTGRCGYAMICDLAGPTCINSIGDCLGE